MVVMSLHGEHVTGAAKIRRERQLRSWLKHERQTVRRDLPPLLSTVSAEVQGGVGGKARAARRPTGTEDGKDHGGHALHDEFQSGQGAGALQPGRRVWRGRPAPLSEVAGWQDIVVRVVRHVMEDLGSVNPFVQILDLPVPQMVGDVADTLRILDRPIAEQVIEVPTFSCSPCPSRSPIPEPQSAEQLVEVPTVLSLALLQQLLSKPLTFQFHMVVVVVFTVLCQDRVQQRLVLSRALTSPFVEAFTVFSQDRDRRRVLWSSFKIFTSVRALQLHPLVLRMQR